MPRWNNKNCGFQKGHKSFLTEEAKKKIGVALTGRTTWAKGKHWKIPQDFERKSRATTGNKNPAWKGGVTPEHQRIRNSREHSDWSKNVIRRDNFTCSMCNIRGGSLIAHHIKSFSDYPDLRFIMDNGVTLCKSCHRKLHQLERDRNGRFKPELNL